MDVRRLERWHADLDAADELVLVGEVDGVPHVTARVARRREAPRVTCGDGSVYLLGQPAPAHPSGDPWMPPAAAVQRRAERLVPVLRRLEQGEGPTADELAGAPVLRGWIVELGPDAASLAGIVEGHPRLADGAWIVTSPLVWIADDRTAARTVSRWYRLGSPLAGILASAPMTAQ
jgi:hypothetical protein